MRRTSKQFALVFCTSLTLAACGGGGSSGAGGSANAVSSGNTATGSATVYWTAPSSTESGAALSVSQLGGYVVSYGTSPTNLAYTVNVPDPYATQFVVTGLQLNKTYYFSVMAYDTQDVDGAPSPVVSKLINS